MAGAVSHSSQILARGEALGWRLSFIFLFI